MFFKRLYEESFEDLQINSNWKFQIRATIYNEMVTIQNVLWNYTKVPF